MELAESTSLQTRPRSRPPYGRPVETLIYLGAPFPRGRLALATRALESMRRQHGEGLRLVVAARNTAPYGDAALPEHCVLRSAGRLGHAIQHGRALLLAPTYDDPQGDVTAQLLAAGIPAGALNLRALPAKSAHAYVLDQALLIPMTCPH